MRWHWRGQEQFKCCSRLSEIRGKDMTSGHRSFWWPQRKWGFDGWKIIGLTMEWRQGNNNATASRSGSTNGRSRYYSTGEAWHWVRAFLSDVHYGKRLSIFNADRRQQQGWKGWKYTRAIITENQLVQEQEGRNVCLRQEGWLPLGQV
jgi:hypothetical protein